MKKKNYSVMGLVQKAIIDSMNFSKRDESQIFIEISPHVDAVQFYAYQGRWDISKERVFDFHIYARGNLSPTVKRLKRCSNLFTTSLKKTQRSNITSMCFLSCLLCVSGVPSVKIAHLSYWGVRCNG